MISSDGERRDGTPCTWKGIDFRSKLERQWAQFFETRFPGQWLYEPYQFAVRTKSWRYRREWHSSITWYVPDFLVENIGVIEIKPTVDVFREESRKIAMFANKFVYVPMWVFCGPPPEPEIIWVGPQPEPSLPLKFPLADIPLNCSIQRYSR